MRQRRTSCAICDGKPFTERSGITARFPEHRIVVSVGFAPSVRDAARQRALTGILRGPGSGGPGNHQTRVDEQLCIGRQRIAQGTILRIYLSAGPGTPQNKLGSHLRGVGRGQCWKPATCSDSNWAISLARSTCSRSQPLMRPMCPAMLLFEQWTRWCHATNAPRRISGRWTLCWHTTGLNPASKRMRGTRNVP